MKASQIAAQLYTVRDYVKDAKGLAESLKKIKKIGYAAVQVSGIGPIPVEEVAAILKGEGLPACATHESGEWILSNPSEVVERLKKLECRHSSYPIPSGINMATPYPGHGVLETQADVETLAARLDAAGEIFRKAGCVLSYHNHHVEFHRFGAKTMLESLFELTRPENLQAELDTYWVQAGGGDPVAWCRRLKGRLPLIHLKDYSVDAGFKPAFAEIGSGNLDFKAIVREAEVSGCQWFIVEQDTCPGDPFDSLAKSHLYLKENLCS